MKKGLINILFITSMLAFISCGDNNKDPGNPELPEGGMPKDNRMDTTSNTDGRSKMDTTNPDSMGMPKDKTKAY